MNEANASAKAATVVPSVSTVVFLVVGIAATAFDALASYSSIAMNKIATEGNVILNIITDIFVSLGFDAHAAFGVTMVIRAVFGIVIFTALFFIARFAKGDNERRMAIFGIYGAGSILTIVALYHLVGVTLFG